MEKRYINESRYKKAATRKRRDASTVKDNLHAKKEVKLKEKKQPKQLNTAKKKSKRKVKQSKLSNIITCIFLLIIIAIISRAILKDENEPFIPFAFFEEANDEIISIGVITEDSLLDRNSKNTVINELNKYSTDMLLEVNDDYSITYKCIANVTKVSNTEYILSRNVESNVSINDIKETLDNYRTNAASVYYAKLVNIDSISVLDVNTLSIKLNAQSPYFIYNLDICLNTSKDATNYILDVSSTPNRLILSRHEDANKELPAKVVVNKYKDMYAAVEAYKNKEIKMFVTNAENVTNILGKYEYNIKAYRNGKTLFLLGNPKSTIYSKEEIRQAIAYSIDRDNIIKDVLKSKGDKIDLPYIYDRIKYKYDVYAAENLLLTSGYKKSNKVYSKTENGVKTTLELNLIVNKEDEEKVSVANRIKNNLSAIGIKINVESLTENKIKTRLEKGNYDLVLASVDLNNVPDISFIKENLYLTEDIELIMDNINGSTIPKLNENIIQLQNMLSDNVSAIGIYSDVSYLIYNKDIVGIQEISYMNLFDEILG